MGVLISNPASAPPRDKFCRRHFQIQHPFCVLLLTKLSATFPNRRHRWPVWNRRFFYHWQGLKVSFRLVCIGLHRFWSAELMIHFLSIPPPHMGGNKLLVKLGRRGGGKWKNLHTNVLSLWIGCCNSELWRKKDSIHFRHPFFSLTKPWFFFYFFFSMKELWITPSQSTYDYFFNLWYLEPEIWRLSQPKLLLLFAN